MNIVSVPQSHPDVQDAASFESEPWRWKEGEKSGRKCVCVRVYGGQEKTRNEKGRETNVRAAVHEIKKEASKILLPAMLYGRPPLKSPCLSFYLSAGKAYVRWCNL